MPAQIRKSDLQRIVREEYARVLLENSGHRVTDARVRLIAERIETGELDEALKDWLGAAGEMAGGALKSLGGKAKELGGKAVGAAKAKYGELEAKAGEREQARLEKEEAEAKQKDDDAAIRAASAISDEILKLRQTAKDRVKKAGAVTKDSTRLVDLGKRAFSDGLAYASNQLESMGKAEETTTLEQRPEGDRGVYSTPAAAGNMPRR